MQRVLLTTPDYPPKLGGLSTFTVNIEKTLKKLNVPYDLFIWDQLKAIKQHRLEVMLKRRTLINIHYMGGYFLDPNLTAEHINFCHGSEILFTSPNPLKQLIKRVSRGKMLRFIHNSKTNFFISKFTMDKLLERGLKLNYARDIVLHNAIDFESNQYIDRVWDDQNVHFVCIARDVPHKNLDGVLKFCELFAQVSKLKVKLSVNADRLRSKLIEIESYDSIYKLDREDLYREAHFNLLLSLDHSRQGFYEGFGLTPLEAARYGTPSIVFNSGGLSENVHHGFNGYVINRIERGSVMQLWQEMQFADYTQMRVQTHEHTSTSHSLDLYEHVLEKFFYA